MLPPERAASEELGEVAHNSSLHLSTDELRCFGVQVHHVVAVMLLPAMMLLHMFYEVFLANKISSLF